MLVMALLFAGVQVRADTLPDERYVKTYDVGEVQVIFDAQVDRPEETHAQPVLVRAAQWTPERLSALFLDGQAVDMEVVRGYIEYDGADGTYLTSEPSGCVDYKAAGISLEHSARLYWDAYSKAGNQSAVEGYPYEEALAQVQALCARAGITEYVVDHYSAIDSQALSETYAKIVRPGSGQTPPPEPQQPPEGYLMYILCTFDGLGLLRMPHNVNTMVTYPQGSALIVYVTRDEGVLEFACAPDAVVYEFLERSTAEAKASISMEQAIDAVVDKYSSVMFNETIQIERIAYEYVPVPVKKKSGQFRLQPAWCFYPTYTGGDWEDPVFVNALNGKIIDYLK